MEITVAEGVFTEGGEVVVITAASIIGATVIMVARADVTRASIAGAASP